MPARASIHFKEKPTMNFRTIKTLAMTSAVSLALLAGANQAHAQATAQIGATFITGAGIVAAAGNGIDFGTWVVNIPAADNGNVTIPLAAVVAGAPGVPVPLGATDPATVVVNTVAPGNGGSVTVTTATPLALQISGVVTTDFTDPTISLGSLVFTDSNDTNTAIPAAPDAATFADTQVATVAETIGIGGTLTFVTSPAASTTFSDALVDITFNF